MTVVSCQASYSSLYTYPPAQQTTVGSITSYIYICRCYFLLNYTEDWQTLVQLGGDEYMYILNRQRATPSVHSALTKLKTHSYWLVGCWVLYAKVVGASSSEGFLVYNLVIYPADLLKVTVPEIRYDKLYLRVKLTSSQLNLPHGAKQKTVMEKLKTKKPRCLEETVRGVIKSTGTFRLTIFNSFPANFLLRLRAVD